MPLLWGNLRFDPRRKSHLPDLQGRSLPAISLNLSQFFLGALPGINRNEKGRVSAMAKLRQKQKAKSRAQAADLGPLERSRHGDLIVIEETTQAGVKRARVDTVYLLDRYKRRKLVELRQYDAGIRLRSTWIDAGREPHLTARYQDIVSGGTLGGFFTGREDARRAYIAALRAIGPIASNEVIAVCLLDEAVGGAVHMEILRRGLDVLADHYRMPKHQA